MTEDKVTASMLAAGYEAYPKGFSDNYFSADTVVKSVNNIKANGFTRDNLQWGYYQKFAPDDPTKVENWTDAFLYYNWESAIAEAREALRKFPVDQHQPGPDPDNPGKLASNMLDHLDTAVRIALFDKYQQGHSDNSGIEIEVRVALQPRPNRRHHVRTVWRPAVGNPSDPKYKYDKLTINMTCPTGGWIGTATWKYTGKSKFTGYAATYQVPDPPEKDDKQILFIFNGLESVPDPTRPLQPAILQPVLQWTSHDRWAIRSWYVPANYTPTLEMMPKLDEQRPFTDANSPAWTKAIQVDPGSVLQGIISWNGTTYSAKFKVGSTDVAELITPNILPLTYPVAVIEAYVSFGKKNLVDIKMENIVLFREDVTDGPVEPSWDVGMDGPTTTGHIHYGTNRLQRYKVTPDYANHSLTFKRWSPQPIK